MTTNPYIPETTLILETDRLILRGLHLKDAPTISRVLNDFEVSRWIATIPYPYEMSDALRFTHNCDAPLRFWMIHKETQTLIGSVAIDRELGYWLARPFWRQGLMKEATAALIAHWFAQGDDELTSGYFVGNARSASVLYHFGFKDAGVTQFHCSARGCEVDNQRLVLTKAAWLSRHSG